MHRFANDHMKIANAGLMHISQRSYYLHVCRKVHDTCTGRYNWADEEPTKYCLPDCQQYAHQSHHAGSGYQHTPCTC